MPPLFQSRLFSVTGCVSTFRSTSVLIILSDKLRELWIIPIFFALVSGVSLVVAWLLGSLLRLDRPHRYDSFELSALVSLKTLKLSFTHRNFAMAAAMIMNSNSLPVALLQSLVVTVPGLQRDKDDTLDDMVARAITYLLLSGTMGQFVSLSLCYCVVTVTDL